MLHAFIRANRAEIIRRCRAKVAGRSMPLPTTVEIDHGVPLFLDQLVEALAKGGVTVNPAIAKSGLLHGHDLRSQGLTVSQVVHDYGDICQSVTDLAIETNAPIGTDDFRTLNRCLDEAIAGAVTTYERENHQAWSDQATDRGNERVAFLVHELRNLVNTATVAFQILRTGSVGITGNTGAVLDRSLSGLRDLIGRALDDVRLTQRVTSRTRIAVVNLIQEVGDTAKLAADSAGVRLTVGAVDPDVAVDGDRQVLAAVVGNRLQNAFKFTRAGTEVILHVGASAERVLIQIQDECGGLPGGDEESESLFRPFEQRSADRSGIGIGLAFSRWGAEANGGRIYATNSGNGCVFTVDLPRVDATVLATA
jgi:signal transduction histidine kinase